ncbi:MAG: hypothetical protein AAF501_10905, partial [Pseudomonadota bacterium]
MALTTIGPNLITNGSFEDVTGTSTESFGFQGAGTITGWSDANGEDLDLHNDQRGGLQATDGNIWLDTDGSNGNIDISQTVGGVETGAIYQLQFDLGQNVDVTGDNGLEVYWGGQLVATIPASSFDFQTISLTLEGGAGDGSNTLRFVGTGTADSNGASLDNVQLALVADANDDSLTVAESEGADGTDLDALANDSATNAAITEVNGSAANVGVEIDGSTGGRFTVSSDGSVAFDADNDYESLAVGETATTSVTYTINSPSPFAPGSQSTQTTGNVGPADQQAFFTFNVGEFTNDGSTNISGSINLSGITQPTFNILFVMDVSGSTGFDSPLFDINGDGVANSSDPDLNGDGDGGEIIDAEIAAFRQLSADIAALGFGDSNVDIGLVTFEDSTPSGASGTEIILNSGGGQN